ncbi:phage shock protein C (PspC) family protein [Actinocorallia herbida]|uniref:Phage shock protein C (PspC) family protein n=1 Tax=Actinocorallia herbida TaxID=58109 RepID=A0A3N1D9M1_9ACTN|nr:ATP-binding protein [Actinocorallia herbida]ROO90179.1 phage shock protein C (PspC) family protein [Actinocorallia herbida]
MGSEGIVRLERRRDGRLLAGVCAGLAGQFGLEPVVVRLAFVVLGAAGVYGIAAYAAFWILTPARDEERRRRDPAQLLAYALLGGGLSLLTGVSGLAQIALWPVLVVGIGAVILWQQAGRDQRERFVSLPQGMWWRSLLGALLVTAGIGGFFAQRVSPQDIPQVLLATAIILTGVTVVITPWLVKLWQELDAERAERVRSQERAEVAAHIHDSVLHTLTLIQRNAHDPKEVARLARSQERDLRAWLYQPKSDSSRMFAAAVQETTAEVEDLHGVPIEVVCVGDCPLDDRIGAMIQAAREAMVNAAKYSGAPNVSVYAEVSGDDLEIFVRDRGKGFDLEGVPADRMGVRGSIIGRMERHGGTARVRSAPGDGTEIRLELKK